MERYDAFISYSHARDRGIATALQDVVQRLGKPWYRRRALRVFRDDTSLAATPALWPSIVDALDGSRFLILLASPEAAASRWVDLEVEHWLAHRGADTLLLALTAGELNWDEAAGDFAWSAQTPLPPALKGRFAHEPRWVDVRDWRLRAAPGAQDFVARAADLAAVVRGMPKEDLLSEELRLQRRALRLAWSAAAAMLGLAVAAGAAGWMAANERDRALRALEGGRIAQSFGFDMVVGGRPAAGFAPDTIGAVVERSRAMQQRLAGTPEMLPDLRRLEAMALRELATTHLVRGDAAAALAAATASREIMTALVALDGASRDWRRELSIAHNRVGEALLRSGDPAGALAAFRAGLDERERVRPADDDAAQAGRDIAVSHERIGDVLLALGDPGAARAHYETSLALRRTLVESDPARPQWLADLAVSHDRMGRLAELSGRVDEAERAYAAARELRRTAVQREPHSPAWQRDLAVSDQNLGRILLLAGRTDAALAALRDSLALREALAQAYPEDVRLQTDVVGSLVELARAGDRPREHYERALAILRRLDGRLDVNQTEWKGAIEQWLAELPP